MGLADIVLEVERLHKENARLREQLVKAKEGLEAIYQKDTRVTDGGKCHDLGQCAEIATATLCALSNENEQRRAPKVRTSHHRNKEEAARLQALVDERYTRSAKTDEKDEPSEVTIRRARSEEWRD